METKRYSDTELLEFKALINKKMDRAKSELSYYLEQLNDIEEKMNDGQDGWTEDAMVMSDIEMLNDFAHRQKKFLLQLEGALIRIHNKSYGICEVTGELIDKRRLMAAPATTKSLKAKMVLPNNPSLTQKEMEGWDAEPDLV